MATYLDTEGGNEWSFPPAGEILVNKLGIVDELADLSFGAEHWLAARNAVHAQLRALTLHVLVSAN